MATKLDVVNAGLNLIDIQSSVSSEQDTSQLAKTAFTAFDQALRKLSSKHIWTYFLRKWRFKNPQPVNQDQDFDFCYSFDLPPDYNRAVVFSGSSLDINLLNFSLGRSYWADYVDELLHFQVHSGRVYTNSESLFGVYLARAEEHLDSVDDSFESALIEGVAAYAAVSLGDTLQLSQVHRQEFEVLARIAINNDLMLTRRLVDTRNRRAVRGRIF